MNKAIIAKTNTKEIFIVRTEKGFHFTDSTCKDNTISLPIESLKRVIDVIRLLYSREEGFTLV